eukprot:m.103659 g.103659  ORF g.103659 m.103659 type:complete len:50 (-) comp10491_c0_seq1:75-224(-)
MGALVGQQSVSAVQWKMTCVPLPDLHPTSCKTMQNSVPYTKMDTHVRRG